MTRPDESDPQRDEEASQRGHDAGSRLGAFSGEFRSRSREAAFARSRLDEMIRHGRWLLVASAMLNTMFFWSDGRFGGTPQFWVAIPARSVIVLASLACLALLHRCRTPGGVWRVLAGWMAVTAIGVAALVSSRNDLALFVVLLLPMIFYLAVPLPFLWMTVAGVSASALLLTGYELYAVRHDALPGLIIALVALNCCLILVVARSKRLQRLEWQATRAACAFADELAASRETLQQVFDAAPVPMIVTRRDDGVILHVNDACAQMFGITAAMIDSASFEQLYADPAQRDLLLKRLDREGRVTDFEIETRCFDGRQRTVLVKAAPVTLASGRAMISGIIDISDRRAVEQSLERLASTDPLTGLPNRLSFFATARAEMTRAARSRQPLALLMIDLDHFKLVNDTFGHQGGDQALKAFADLCRDRLRGDIGHIGRLGGEEFAILLPDTDAARALMLAQHICHGLTALRLAEPHATLRLSASIGLTLVRQTDRDLDAALARADRALYAAKDRGRDRVHFDPADVMLPVLAAAR